MTFYSIESEAAALGSILKEPELIYESILSPEHFYDSSHQIIFENMLQMRDEDKTIDPVSIVSKLGEKTASVGGVQYLVNMSSSVPSTQQFYQYEMIIKEKYLLRTGMESMKKIYQETPADPKELAAELMTIAETIGDQVRTGEGFRKINEGLMRHFELVERRLADGLEGGVVTFGAQMDKIIGKWQKQSLNVIAARPSVGKTACLLQNVVKAARKSVTVAVFSLEQPEDQLYDRMISAEGRISGEALRTGILTDEDWTKYTASMAALAELDIYVDDRPGLTVQEIRAAVRKLRKTHPELIVFIDYLQLVQSGKRFSNRTEEVGYISGSLKQMARENNCPVIALAQLSRSVEQRQDKRPMQSDLRESGNIEQDADTITFLYRDDYYNQETEKKNIIECIVAKNRNGSIGTAEMVNLREYGLFLDLDVRHHA